MAKHKALQPKVLLRSERLPDRQAASGEPGASGETTPSTRGDVMASAGDELVNAVTGLRTVFRQLAAALPGAGRLGLRAEHPYRGAAGEPPPAPTREAST